MNPDKSKARVQQGPRPPPGFPPGVVVPTGPRAINPVRRPPPGPIKLGNRQIPNVPSPVSLTKITYKEALEEILKQTGPYPMRFTTLPSIQTSIVLYDPRGEVVKAGEGLLLKEDVSLCYLITWLQIFTDNYRAKYNPGVELVIRSVEFRFRDKLAYMSYPNLEGGLSYYNDNGIATACVNWPCGNSLMEQYWEAFRSMMQLGGDDQIKYPIIKIRTVKYLAGDPYGMETKKRLGGGHVFVINEENLDVHLYFNRLGQQIPESLVQLDQWLTESDNRQLSQDTVEESRTQTGAPGDQMQSQGEPIKPAGASSSFPRGQPQIGQKTQMKSNTSHSSAAVTTTGPLLADSRGKTRTTKHNYPGRDGKLPNNNASALIRQQPSKMAFIPSGDSTLQIPVPFRPPVHRDPQKNWRRFQRSGGFSLLHNAFPLDHLVYDPKDMPEIPTPPPIIGGYSNNGGQLGQQNDANEKEAAQGAKNVNTNADNTAGNDFDTDSSKGINEPYGAAIGFSSDDDELYFPAWNMKENATSADANRLPKPLHRHGHRPSQNDNMIKDKQMQNKFGQGRIVPVADYAVAGTKAPSKSELPQKKLTSTMNVNAPEFVNTSASVYPPPGFEFRMNPLAPGFATQPQPQPGLPSMMMNYDLQPFPVMHIPPPMAMPGHYPPPPYPGQYPPRVMGEPNFWANRGHKENTAAPSRPAANPSKPSYANIARRQFDHRGGPNKGSAGQSTTIDALNRQVSQQTLGRPGRREARGEGFKKPDDKPSTFHKSNNSASSKNFRAVKKGPP